MKAKEIKVDGWYIIDGGSICRVEREHSSSPPAWWVKVYAPFPRVGIAKTQQFDRLATKEEIDAVSTT
jgi:hypothetical protein